MDTIEFVPIQKEHLESLLDIEAECFNPGWSRATLNAILSDESSHFLVAFSGNEIAGYGGIRIVLDEANLDNIAVYPKFQRLGIGEKLLLKLIEVCKNSGVKTLMLEVRESNQSAISLYEKLGFVAVGKRGKYYTKPDEAAILMNLEV